MRVSTLILVLAAFASAASVVSRSSTSAEQLEEANARFTYFGKPINPRAVSDLMPSLSDTVPGPVAIDLAGTSHSNRYFGEYRRREDGAIIVDLAAVGRSTPECLAEGWFAYRHLGTLPGGIHVLITEESGGGSGIFENVLLVTFSIDFEYRDDGSRRERLTMERVGQIVLADRSSSTVEIRGDTLRIGADPRTGKPARVLRFN